MRIRVSRHLPWLPVVSHTRLYLGIMLSIVWYQFKKDRGRKLLYGCFLLLVSGPNGSNARYISIYENPEAFGHDNIHQPPP